MRSVKPTIQCECGDHSFKSLTKGFITMVSPGDAHILESSSWYADVKKNGVYARTNARLGDERLHRRIINPSNGNVVDHKSGNGLDNRRENLREATLAQNSINRLRGKKAKSGYIGVFKRGEKWASCVRKEHSYIHVGTFNTDLEAAIARDLIVIRDYGEFASLNFPLLRERVCLNNQ